MIAKWDLVPFVRGDGIDIGEQPAPFRHMMRFSASRIELLADHSLDFACLRGAVTAETVREAWYRLRVGGHLIVWGKAAQGLSVPQALGTECCGWDWLWHDEAGEGDEATYLQVFRKASHGEGREEFQQRPDRCAAVARPGGTNVGYGDALWASSVIAQLHGMGYHVTAYVDGAGEEALRHDPNVGRFVVDALKILGPEDQAAYWRHEAGRYDRWVNLTHAVEGTMLFDPSQMMTLWPKAARHARASGNYLEAIHAVAGLPYVPAQRFYPTPEEKYGAAEVRGEHKIMVVLADTGSTETKWWPGMAQFAAELVEAYPDMLVVALGKLRSDFPEHPRIKVIGTDGTWRQAAAIAMEADIVVGQETGLLNAVAFEENHKVVLLTHSTAENLTRDWRNTETIAAEHLPCYPCHILHFDGFRLCAKDAETGAAACQASIRTQWVREAVERAIHGWIRSTVEAACG